MKLLSGNFGRARTKGLVFRSEALTMLHESVNNLGFAFTKPVPGCARCDHISWNSASSLSARARTPISRICISLSAAAAVVAETKQPGRRAFHI
jgi:hypothetical protein